MREMGKQEWRERVGEGLGGSEWKERERGRDGRVSGEREKGMKEGKERVCAGRRNTTMQVLNYSHCTAEAREQLLSPARRGSGFLTNQQAHEYAKQQPPARFVLQRIAPTVLGGLTHSDMLGKLHNTPPRIRKNKR